MKQRTKIWLRKARKPFLDYMRNISFQIVVAGLIGFLGYRALTASLGGPRVVSVICLAGFVVILIVSFIANASLLKEDLYSSFYAWQALTSKRFRRIRRQNSYLRTSAHTLAVPEGRNLDAFSLVSLPIIHLRRSFLGWSICGKWIHETTAMTASHLGKRFVGGTAN